MLLEYKPISVKSSPVKKVANPAQVRDRLANERTYLAWMRTAIAMMGFGVVIIRLRLLQPALMPHSGIGWKLGLMFSLVGLVSLLFSTRRYFWVCQAMEEDFYEPADLYVLCFSLAVIFLATGVIYFVFSAPFSLMSAVMAE